MSVMMDELLNSDWQFSGEAAIKAKPCDKERYIVWGIPNPKDGIRKGGLIHVAECDTPEAAEAIVHAHSSVAELLEMYGTDQEKITNLEEENATLKVEVGLLKSALVHFTRSHQADLDLRGDTMNQCPCDGCTAARKAGIDTTN